MDCKIVEHGLYQQINSPCQAPSMGFSERESPLCVGTAAALCNFEKCVSFIITTCSNQEWHPESHVWLGERRRAALCLMLGSTVASV